MNRKLIWLAMLLCFVLARDARAATSGPFQDFKASVENPSTEAASFPFPTWYYCLVNGRLTICTDTIIINMGGNESRVNVAGGAWETIDDPGSGNRQITTLYGVDLNPDDPTRMDLHMTGFNSTQAAAISFSDEAFIGRSGTLYPGTSLGTPTLGELPALLPGFDLSVFSGDEASVVYAFRTTVPIADFAVAEPSTFLLALVGLLGLASCANRMRPRAKKVSAM